MEEIKIRCLFWSSFLLAFRYRKTGAVIKLKWLNGDKWLVTQFDEIFYALNCEAVSRIASCLAHIIISSEEGFWWKFHRKRHRIKSNAI